MLTTHEAPVHDCKSFGRECYTCFFWNQKGKDKAWALCMRGNGRTSKFRTCHEYRPDDERTREVIND